MKNATKLGLAGLALLAGLYTAGCSKSDENQTANDSFSYLSQEGMVIKVSGDNAKIIREMYGEKARMSAYADLVKSLDKNEVEIARNRFQRDAELGKLHTGQGAYERLVEEYEFEICDEQLREILGDSALVKMIAEQVANTLGAAEIDTAGIDSTKVTVKTDSTKKGD